MSSFIFGVVGFYLMKEGKKNLNFAWVAIGIVLMIYTIFVPNDWGKWIAGFALSGIAYYYR
jgi:hypothetical protein